jgi:outer membrane protein OmpA-like peptidoglycan-associated protein
MKTILSAIVTMLILSALAVAQVPGTDPRHTVAVRYPQGKETSVSIIGTGRYAAVIGKAEVKRTDGRTRVKLKMDGLANPQALGAIYTTYVLWAVAPEGQADNLAEVPFKGDVDIDVTTPLQTFGLIITAEPYGTVKLPSPTVIAENVLRDNTKGTIESSRIEYRGDLGALYEIRSMSPDYDTPLLILGARQSVEIAKRAGATKYADAELRKAEVHLAALEEMWPHERNQEKHFGGLARDIMREAESAREIAMERSEQARLDAERDTAARHIRRADERADEAQQAAAAAQQDADAARQRSTRAEQEADAAKQQVAQAQDEADRAKANEADARAQADAANQQAQKATQDKEALEQRLYDQISVILDTRREARGLVVNLSDVLFDTGQATLKPGAREKLSKLAGILLAYPGAYRMEIDGHTDSVGGDDFNQRLSEQRAMSVQSYLTSQSISPDRITAVRGFGKTMPVATNDTAEGRQQNRRVEIVISDTNPTNQ